MDLVTFALAKKYTDKSRTHWEESPDVDIVYDGNVWDQYFIYDDIDQIYYIKLSDAVPTVEALMNATVVVTRKAGSENETKTTEKALVWPDQSYAGVTLLTTAAQDSVAFVIREPNLEFFGKTFKEAGTYIMLNAMFSNSAYISEIHIPAIRHRLDGKYLPEGTPWVENLEGTVVLPETAVNINGSITQLDNLIGLVEGEKYRVTCRGVDYERVCKPVEALYEGMPAFVYYIGNGSLMDYGADTSFGLENTGEPFIICDFLNVKYAEDACLAINQVMMGIYHPQEGDTLSVTHIAQEFHDIPEKNRTHWAEKVDVPLDIRLDKNKMLYYYCPYGGGVPQTWVHLSDRILNLNELTQCTVQLNDGSVISLDALVTSASDWGTSVEIASDDYKSYALRIVDKPDELAPDAKPGVYFKVETEYPDKQIMRLYSEEVTMPGLKYHKLPPEYAPEIPLFDFTEMGLPTIEPDLTGTGTFVQAVGDFSEFENALKRGAVRVRTAINTGTREAYITSMTLPFYEEENQVWQLTTIGLVNFEQPTFRVSVMYFPPRSAANDNDFGVLRANCAMLQHYTVTA